MERSFKGIWIPKEIWLSDDLGWTEKFLLAEIDSLSQSNECFATNEHFAKFFNISKDRVSKIISSLSHKGYAEVSLIYKEGTKQVEKRIITTRGYRRKQLEGIGENNYTPIGENTEDNNTVINNTITNTKKDNAHLHSQFESFWSEYPRKVDKKKASTSFLRALKKHSLEEIVNGTKRYAALIKHEGTEVKFIKHASTFLNNECYLEGHEITKKGGNRNGGADKYNYPTDEYIGL
jgi:hypothetical protein